MGKKKDINTNILVRMNILHEENLNMHQLKLKLRFKDEEIQALLGQLKQCEEIAIQKEVVIRDLKSQLERIQN